MSKMLRWLEPLGCPMYEVGFSHSLDFNDTRAKVDPDAVWGRLLDVGVGAIQTDIVDTLTQYICLNRRTL